MPSSSAGSALGDDDDYHTSSSEITTTEVSGSHVLTISGYYLARELAVNEFISSSFTLAGHSWSIRFYPNGSRITNYGADGDYYASIYLVAATPDVVARFSIILLNKAGQPYYANYENQFRRMSSEPRGFQKFIRRKELEQLSCVRYDDTIRISCDITILKVIKHQDAITAASAAPRFVVVPPSDLLQQLGKLLSTGDGADVKFEVGGETFSAHRSILAARSPVFKAELFSPMKEGNTTTTSCVLIRDMEPRVFRAMLDFVYTDVFPADVEGEGETMAMAQHLLVAADRYGLERLKLMCEEKLCGYIDVCTAGTILTLAEQHGCDGLKKACLEFLMSGQNLTAAIVTGGFEHLTRSCPSILKDLIAILEGLNI